MKTIATIRAVAGAFILAGLIGCSGGGGDGGSGSASGDGGNINPSPPPASSNWDQMVWDQDVWG